jgi:hypothetical protein
MFWQLTIDTSDLVAPTIFCASDELLVSAPDGASEDLVGLFQFQQGGPRSLTTDSRTGRAAVGDLVRRVPETEVAQMIGRAASVECRTRHGGP